MPARAFALLALVAAALPASARAAKCPTELPALFVVQDKSGTMADPPDPACPSCPSKWTTAKGAVADLTVKYSNRFRFGLQMYPRDATTFNCTTGTTVAPFPATTAAITNAFASAAPGGGTPTAASLDAAAGYLKSLSLTTPGYLLLLTDGLPNCNLALDPATCSPSQPACTNATGVGSPNCGAKGCLDDQGAKAAAARALAAGYKVYVVGFDAAISTNVNKAVLDGIAVAGGTAHAYTATDPVTLAAALDAIAFDASNCCMDSCGNGQTRCSAGGQLESCRLDTQGECTLWTTTPCATKSVCSNGVCQSCQDECTAGALRCSGATAQKCVVQASGCTKWIDVKNCGYSEICVNGACQSCGNTCAADAKRCSGADVQACELNLATGCTDWATRKCVVGSVCANGTCASCAQTCQAGQKRCAGKTIETCVADASGCTAWKPGTICTEFCSGGACGACGTTCTEGAKRCNGSSIETCARDANGCTDWTSGGPCAAGELCSGGMCLACPATCTAGEKRCATGGVQECKAQATGCFDWAPATACAAGETCQSGKCLPQCRNECALGEGKCDAAGLPVTCAKAPSGCTVWKTEAACAGGQTCVAGACRGPCSGGEIETCPTGFVCTGTPEGRFCLPVEGPKPVSTDPNPDTDPAGTLPGADDPSGTSPSGTPGGAAGSGTVPGAGGGAGCGCASAPSPLALGLGLLAVALLRRRRRG